MTTLPAPASPRDVADKRKKRALLAAIRMALRVESAAVLHNTQTFNRNRYVATAALPDYESLKDRARAIKEESIERLPELVTLLEASVTRNSGHFFLAANAEEACRYVSDVCTRAGAKLVVKGKSMTSEEIGLNHALEQHGIEVAETDLAEFILQVANEQPSHIIAPAIHYSRERITALFKRVFRTDEALDSGEELTRFARERLRQKFLSADVGITGANLIAADSGTLVLVESEANIRMTTMLPRFHIAVAGVEKIIPARRDLAPFIELLAASATGQSMASYTSVLCPPLQNVPVLNGNGGGREFHLVVIDNGRLRMRQDPVLREALRCIRCSACLNSCANFQTVGGHAFGGEVYSGGIGGPWEAGTRGLEYSRFAELCTGCSRCVPQCPVRIDIPWLNTVLRQRLNESDAAKLPALHTHILGIPAADRGASLQKIFFGRFDLLGKVGSRLSWIVNRLSGLSVSRAILEKAVGLDRRREPQLFAQETLVKAGRRMLREPQSEQGRATVVLFADIFTNHSSPARGLATLRVLASLGIGTTVSRSLPDGRAPLSQGMIATAAEQARSTAAELIRIVETGRSIIVIEPSVLAMFRLDYRHLLTDAQGQAMFQKLRENCFDAGEYIWSFIQQNQLNAARLFPAALHPCGTRIFFHGHCQQKTIGASDSNIALLKAAGFDVVASQVECCGMAGSFGYKKEFYDLSMAVGADLFAQVRDAERNGGERNLVASGTSCAEQLRAGLGREVLHPMELLAEGIAKG